MTHPIERPRSKAPAVHRFAPLLCALLPLCLAAACAPGEDGSGEPDGHDPGRPTTMMPNPPAPPVPKDALQLHVGPVDLRAGEERTVCVTRRLPTTEAMNVSHVATRQTHSHHVIFYRYAPGSKPRENSTPERCGALDLFDGGTFKIPVFIGESSDDAQNQLQLPPGVAYHFGAGDYYTIEMHLLNASPSPAQANADVLLVPIEKGVPVVYADMIFANGERTLRKSYDGGGAGIPPMQALTTDPTFAAVSGEAKIFALTTHQHRFGTDLSIYRSTGVADGGTLLLRNTDWAHPALLRYPDNAPLTFAAGEGMRWVCSYRNTTSNYVTFGSSAETDEMCIIWAYYYPSTGFKIVWN